MTEKDAAYLTHLSCVADLEFDFTQRPKAPTESSSASRRSSGRIHGPPELDEKHEKEIDPAQALVLPETSRPSEESDDKDKPKPAPTKSIQDPPDDSLPLAGSNLQVGNAQALPVSEPAPSPPAPLVVESSAAPAAEQATPPTAPPKPPLQGTGDNADAAEVCPTPTTTTSTTSTSTSTSHLLPPATYYSLPDRTLTTIAQTTTSTNDYTSSNCGSI